MPALQDPDAGDGHFKTVAVLQVMGGQGSSDMFEYFKILMLVMDTLRQLLYR